MLERSNNSPLRCPKCNRPMRVVEDPPHFAQFLPWRSFTCELCHIGLSYPPDEENGTAVSVYGKWKKAL
jgi:hypothetical protein